MGSSSSSGNSAGFTSQLKSGLIPTQSHISYEGVFNELTFKIGPKAVDLLEIFTGICRSENPKSIYDSKVNDYLALFTKCSKDGQPRDSRRLNSVVVVDVSGSMNCPLSGRNPGSSRINLTKQAIKMFVSKLQDNDSFGLVIFTDTAHSLIPCTLKKNLDLDIVFKKIDSLSAGGGTTLSSGFHEGAKNLRNFLSQNVKQGNTENRILMITDVGDNFGPCGPILKTISQSEIHTTIIGISEQFQSATCEALKEVKGFNYFCAVEQSDLKKYLFQNFDFTFFPCLYNVQIKLQNKNISTLDVYGTPDSARLNEYNQFCLKGISQYTITKIPTLFPSELQYVSDNVLTHGGLILIKISPKTQLKQFKGKLIVSYQDLSNSKHQIIIDLNYELPLNEQFYSNQSLEEAIRGFYFVSQMKEILRRIEGIPLADRSQGLGRYLQALESLKTSAPEQKVSEVELMITNMKKALLA